MSELQLIYFIPRFILEVRERIVKNTHLTACINGLWATKANPKKSLQLIYSAPPILTSAKTLDSELKRLKAKGLGMTVNKAEPISLEEEEFLLESGALGSVDSMTLS